MSSFTLAELAKEAAREVAVRRSFYPKWVAAGRMTRNDADRKIAMMETIAEKLAAGADDEPVEETLL